MAQIGFTHKTEEIYDRFNAMRRAYEDANGGGRVYNPDFLTVLMDWWEEKGITMLDLLNATKDLDGLTQDEIAALDAAIEEQPKHKSLQDRIRERQEKANSQPVRIKDSNNRYINNAIVATTNLFLTDDRIEAMVFDSPDKAKEFLCKYGRSAEGWIFELENETE